MIEPKFRWRLSAPVDPDEACLAAAAEHGISERLLRLLVGRGVADPAAIARFLAPPEAALHDPALLPDAGVALRRVAEARSRGERVLVFGDFDADGLTGLSILVLVLRRLGLDASPYVPERLDEGHGLSLRAIDRAVAEGRSLIVTADCGTTSGAEIELAVRRGVDVLVTDHHHAATWPAAAVAVVNPHRPDSRYPERQLTGAGVAWKVAHLLLGQLGSETERGSGDGTALPDAVLPDAVLPDAVRELADLALIGTIADVAPVVGENRAIARLGLERLRAGGRPGIVALLAAAGLTAASLDLESIGFAIAPRLNAAGRVGEAARAARLLLAEDAAEAAALAAEIESANLARRELTRTAVAEAQAVVAADDDVGGGGGSGSGRVLPALLVRGEWPVGIVGLIAGRLAEEHGRPAVVATVADTELGIMRASCRSPRGFDLAAALVACGDLFVRHGGHAAAAGFEMAVDRWPEFEARFVALAAAAELPEGPQELELDIVLRARDVDYPFVREIALLEPMGPGNPVPLLGVAGLTIVRARPAAGGHTQLVLRRERDVVDGIAFRRPDLADALREGDRVDVVARATSRRFGGFESIQLEVLDVAAEGTQPAVAVRSGAPATRARTGAA